MRAVPRVLVLGAALAAGCSAAEPQPRAEPPLAEVYEGAFRVGVALNARQITGRDSRGRHLALHHFNTLTPENALKWERVHPRPGRYTFRTADRFVELAEANGLHVVGHTLVWHNQTPDWVFEDDAGRPVSRDTLLARMRDHIHTVVGRYRGRIDGWDVVNEALAEDGTLRPSPWLEIIGEDYIAKAFEYAHEADPDAELYYNDYSLPNPRKRAGAVSLIRRLQEAGVPVDGIGLQGHYRLDWPSVAQLDSTLEAFADLGVRIMITELDIDVLPRAASGEEAEVGLRVPYRAELDPYADGLPAAQQAALARRYAELFDLFLAHRHAVDRVTFWGVHDGASWLNDWPVRGRTSHPLLFDREGDPKDAFHAVITRVRDETAH